MTAILNRPVVEETTETIAPSHTGTLTITNGPLAGTLDWDTANDASVAAVKEKFDAAVAAGMLGYDVKAGGDKTVTRTFDPDADAVVFSRALVGG